MTRWTDMADRMDKLVIKKDGTATDIEYFMATHVPFQDLEFVEFGETESFVSSSNLHLTEEEIYERYIVNKANKHQMLIVRGTNGTGKSHLICWLYNRLTADRVNYDDSREKVIFAEAGQHDPRSHSADVGGGACTGDGTPGEIQEVL